MKKLFLLSLFLVLFAKNDEYLNYTNELIHYKFELKNFNKIKAPMEENVVLANVQKLSSNSLLEKKIDIKLISVLNKSAYLLIKEYLGSKLLKSYKKWVKPGVVFEKYYKVEKVTLNKVILKYKNRLIIKTLDKKIPGIKEK